MTLEQANRVIPLVAGVVTVVVYIIAAPYIKAAREKKRQAASLAPSLPSDAVNADEKARPYSMFKLIAILISGILLSSLIGVARYYSFGFGMSSEYKFIYAMAVGGGLGILWVVVGGVVVQCRRDCDWCPKCGKRQFYYKSDRGKFMSCTHCDSAWKAGLDSE